MKARSKISAASPRGKFILRFFGFAAKRSEANLENKFFLSIFSRIFDPLRFPFLEGEMGIIEIMITHSFDTLFFLHNRDFGEIHIVQIRCHCKFQFSWNLPKTADQLKSRKKETLSYDSFFKNNYRSYRIETIFFDLESFEDHEKAVHNNMRNREWLTGTCTNVLKHFETLIGRMYSIHRKTKNNLRNCENLLNFSILSRTWVARSLWFYWDLFATFCLPIVRYRQSSNRLCSFRPELTPLNKV